MYSFPEFYPKMSDCLSGLLDTLGLDTETVEKRRNIYLITEQMWTDMSNEYNVTVHHFGSQTEGTTTTGLNSDLDSLTCFNVANIVNNIKQWEKDRLNLLIEVNEKTAPGYCRLRCLRNDTPRFETDQKTTDCNHLLDRDHVYLKNSYILSITEQICRFQNYPFIKKGPSGSGTDKIDFVTAFRYKGHPESVLISKGNGQWPSQNLMGEALTFDSFIVPVGHPESENECAEWRISASMTERILMFNLNETQLKCYVIMKMLKETLFKPYVGDSVTSYHCKNALFHTISNTSQDIWQSHNLFACIQLNLVTLLSFLRIGYFPQFLNPDVNLFVGKVTRRDCKTLVKLIEGAVENNLRSILTIKIDNLGTLFIRKACPMTYICNGFDTLRKVKSEEDYYNRKSIDSKAWRNWLGLHFIFVSEFTRHSGSYIANYIIELDNSGFRVSCNEPEEHSRLDVVGQYTQTRWNIPQSVKLGFKEIMQRENQRKTSATNQEERRLVHLGRRGKCTCSIKQYQK